jgi:predicted Zn-dependent peptidase
VSSARSTPADGVTLTTLPSGVRVVSEHMPAVRSVAVGFWVGVGSRDERDEVAGASHFLEHLLFKGTARRTALQIAEEIDAVGGDMNAFTSKEYTCFYARCLDRDLELAVDVLADMITSASIAPEDVDAERSVVLEEIRMHLDTPDDLVHSDFSSALYGGNALGREVLGDEATITAMPRDHVHGYYAGTYVPDNLVVAAAGNVDHDQLVALVEHALEGWSPRRMDLPPRLTPADLFDPVASVRAKPTEQAHVLLGRPGLRRGDASRYAAYVLNQALGGGMASRLFQEIREKRGLAYSVYSYQSMHADTGSFGIYAGTAPANAEKVLQLVRDELLKVLGDGLSEEEMARAKGALAGGTILALEDTSSRMNRLGRALTTDTPLLGLDETLAAIEAVEVDDVVAMARRLLSGPFAVAVVGPFEAADRRFADMAEPLAA